MPGAGAALRHKERRRSDKRRAARNQRWRRAWEQLKAGRVWSAFRTIVFFRLSAISIKTLGYNIFQPYFDSDPIRAQQSLINRRAAVAARKELTP